MTRRLIMLLCMSWLTVATHAQQLREGDKAPYFEVYDVYGEHLLKPWNKQSKTFVAFMRYVGCPVCNHRTHELIESYDILKASGYELIVVYESHPEVLKKYLKESPVPFRIVGDPKRELYKKYKVSPSFLKTIKSAFNRKTTNNKKAGNALFGAKKYKRDGKLTGIPADFIISAEGVIEKVHYGKTIADHLPLKEIIK